MVPNRKPEMGKWLLYSFFHRNSAIAPYLPDTKKYTHESFSKMLKKYRVVYVKPVAGSQGKGIMKAWYDAKGQIVIKKTIEKSASFSDLDKAVHHIDKLQNGKMYIVQKGIDLARINGRPFDIRVMMQREKPGGKWQYTAMCAKIAGGQSIVTNTALSRGRVVNVEKALKMSLGWDESRINSTVSKLQKLGAVWANHFDSYQNYRELGFDVAVDKSGHILLIEQNTAPSHRLFAHNKENQKPYQRIQYRWGQFERARRKKA